MSRPGLHLRPAHALLAGAAVGVVAAGLSLVHVALFGRALRTGEPATVADTWRPALLVNLVYWASWGVLAPVAGRFSRRFPVSGPRWPRRLAGHLLGGTGVACLHVLVVAATISWLRPDAVTFLERAAGIFLRTFDWELVTYAALVGLWHAVDHQAAVRDREAAAARLERELIGSQLQVLQRQLQPHFVLNALHKILQVVERDAAGAGGMIVRLGELLRATVKSLGTQEVTLGEELAFVRRYLEFQPPETAARVSFDVPPGFEDLLVPNLVVQGLVENALKYGVDPRRPGSGSVLVRALLSGSRLRLEVQDDGPGLRPTPAVAGTGLANLEARLSHLYGESYRLEFVSSPGAGLLARVEVPLRAAATTEVPVAFAGRSRRRIRS